MSAVKKEIEESWLHSLCTIAERRRKLLRAVAASLKEAHQVIERVSYM